MIDMYKSYVVTCNLIEIQHCMMKVINIVRSGRCVGFSRTDDKITFHFPTKGGAMIAFLELETFLGNVSVSTNPLDIKNIKLKGVFKYA